MHVKCSPCTCTSDSHLECCRTHCELCHPAHTLKMRHKFKCKHSFELVRVIKLECILIEECGNKFEHHSWFLSVIDADFLHLFSTLGHWGTSGSALSAVMTERHGSDVIYMCLLSHRPCFMGHNYNYKCLQPSSR